MMSSRLARPAFAAARRTAPRTATRTYAAPAAQDTKPLVPLFGLDGTYANALVCELTRRNLKAGSEKSSAAERLTQFKKGRQS